MSEQIHILSVSKGSWDDYYRVNIGVFDTKEAAEEAAKQFLQIREDLINKIKEECPVSWVNLEKILVEGLDFDDYENLKSMSEEDQEKFYHWDYKRTMVSDINKEYFIESQYLNTMDLSQILNNLE